MKPEEKAKDLIDKFLLHKIPTVEHSEKYWHIEDAKKYALICVEELIEVTGSKYWYDVKKHINSK